MGLIPVVQPDITFINRISDFSQHFIEPFNVKGKKLTLNITFFLSCSSLFVFFFIILRYLFDI